MKRDRTEYFKKYYQANKEKYSAFKETHKEKRVVYSKVYNESKKDGLYTVYYLKEDHYAGMTSSLYLRLKSHKAYGKHIEDVEIIGKYKTKKEATRVEAALHAMGYLGRHPKAKKQTLKQLL